MFIYETVDTSDSIEQVYILYNYKEKWPDMLHSNMFGVEIMIVHQKSLKNKIEFRPSWS